MFSRLGRPAGHGRSLGPRRLLAHASAPCVAAITTVISVLAALLMSWVLCRTAIQGKSVFAVLLTVPMLVPSLAHGMSLVYLLGVERYSRTCCMDRGPSMGSGRVMGSFLLLVPAGLSHDRRRDALRGCNALPGSGRPGHSQAQSVRPHHASLLRKPLISAAFATFALVITD